MHCNTLIEPACRAAGHLLQTVTGAAAGGVLGGIALAVMAGVKWIVADTATWWVQIPSPDLAAEPAVTRIQQWLLPITAAVAVGGVVAAGARMALTRRANPLLDVTGGLLTIAAASTLGTAAITLLLKAGDAWSTWILQVSTGEHFTQRMDLVLQLGGGAAAAVVLVFGLIAIVLSLIQAILMLFRQAALLILAGVLPLAAAGSIAPMTRAWVRKITAWTLALICYKPAAAAVYATAFTMVGSGRSPRTALMGFVMMLLSVLMLPALMRFFTWTTGTIGSSGGGGGQLLGAATMGAVALGTLGPFGGGGARAQAAHIDSSLGSPPDSGPGAPPGGSGSGPGGGGRGTGGGPGGASSGGSAHRPAWSGAGSGGAWSSSAGAGTSSGGPSSGPATPAGGAQAGATAPHMPAGGAGAASSGGAAAGGAASGVGAAFMAAAEAARAAGRAGGHTARAMGQEDRP